MTHSFLKINDKNYPENKKKNDTSLIMTGQSFCGGTIAISSGKELGWAILDEMQSTPLWYNYYSFLKFSYVDAHWRLPLNIHAATPWRVTYNFCNMIWQREWGIIFYSHFSDTIWDSRTQVLADAHERQLWDITLRAAPVALPRHTVPDHHWLWLATLPRVDGVSKSMKENWMLKKQNRTPPH